MRCSKCGYISFDLLESCRKCHKPMADAGFKGTTCTVAVPSFLQLSEEKNNGALEEDMVDILDPDLELLADGDDEEIDFGARMVEAKNDASRGAAQSTGGSDAGGEISFSDEFDIAFDVESKESDLSLGEDDLLLDTSRFESVPVSLQAMQAARPVQLEIPADLADISDLARPDRAPDLRPESREEMTADLDVDLDFADLDLDDLDLPAAQQKAAVPASLAREDDFADLFLDDIDLSGDLEVEPPQSSSSPVEDDLDLDLDLGALGSEKGKPEKKKSDDLADLELSLD